MTDLRQAAARRIRLATPADRDALYDICVLTGASGADATGHYRYPDLLGDVFVGPYLELEPDLAFVVDDGSGPEGYVLGALDTARFDARCEQLWWPGRRQAYAGVMDGAEHLDAWLLGWITSPPATPAFVVDYPSHLHIDLLPTLQGGGWGRRLIETLCDALRTRGSHGVHLGVSATNDNAIGFYRHLGFVDLTAAGPTRWMGLSLT
jgi:ribosomal protein S18 acetylase RimI-like enzyme